MDNPFQSKLFLRSFLGTTLALVVMFVAMFLFSVPFIQQTVEGIEENHARTALNAAYHAVENLHLDMEQERVAAVLARKRLCRTSSASSPRGRAVWSSRSGLAG